MSIEKYLREKYSLLKSNSQAVSLDVQGLRDLTSSAVDWPLSIGGST